MDLSRNIRFAEGIPHRRPQAPVSGEHAATLALLAPGGSLVFNLPTVALVIDNYPVWDQSQPGPPFIGGCLEPDSGSGPY